MVPGGRVYPLTPTPPYSSRPYAPLDEMEIILTYSTTYIPFRVPDFIENVLNATIEDQRTVITILIIFKFYNNNLYKINILI